MQQPTPLRIATRSSPMALAQAELVADRLDADGAPTELVPLTTSGDQWTGDLSRLGGKGAFVKEIDRAVLSGAADLAVHCLKDIPGDTPPPEGLELVAYLPREGVCDAVITPASPDGSGRPSSSGGLDALAPGAVVGTSALRRQAQIRRGWPHLEVRPVRGNANTRLSKLDAGEFDVLVLAAAGLHRIGLPERISAELSMRQMLPAIGAGQLVLAIRSDDDEARRWAEQLDDEPSRARATAERSMLAALGGSCDSPIAGHAWLTPDRTLTLHGAVYAADGSRSVEMVDSAPQEEAESLGKAVGVHLLERGARDLI